jgi:hypothetical protein
LSVEVDVDGDRDGDGDGLLAAPAAGTTNEVVFTVAPASP